MIVDDDIFAAIQLHPWKCKRRAGRPITLVELHATRGGIAGRTALEEYSATINWFKSPNNINEALTRPWASMSSYIVGGGKVCRVMPDDWWPSFSLGHADPNAISIEIGQTLANAPFDPRDIDNAARICAEASLAYGIPVRVLPFLSVDNHEAPGYVRHDRSANGGYYGKSDPGPLFDDRAFEAKVRGFMGQPEQEGDDMDFLKWVCVVKAERDQKHLPFRSYRMYMGADGPYLAHDKDGAAFSAMEATGEILQQMGLARLKAIPLAPGSPAPDAP